MSATIQPIRSETGRSARIPWYVWCTALAVTSATIGGRWDVSWHESIGRDTFWTPAHMAIYLCGVLGCVVCGYLILNTTLRRPPELMAQSVRVMGFAAPLGAFLVAWGGVAMLTSAPFDNWWHNAYGLDVKIVSPPHTLLMLGTNAIEMGSLLLALAAMNRVAEHERLFRRLQNIVLYLFGLMLMAVLFFCTEYIRDVLLHGTIPYIAVSLGVPLCFSSAWVASRHRWSCTWIASMYTIAMIGFILILPLFPAQPKLGPVYQPVTHFVPPQFPLLILVPAVLLDLLWQWVGNRSNVLPAAAGAPVFVLGLVAAEWPFASFLMTKAAENRFFATAYHPYMVSPFSASVLRHFSHAMHGMRLYRGLGIAVVCAFLSLWVGFVLGGWMRRLQR
jgi:hypothetical protein